jgi:UDP-glucuronate 4-epimerase
MSKEVCLVTGIAGFIGYHLAKKLIIEGYHVLGLDNLNDYYDKSLKIDRLANLGIFLDGNIPDMVDLKIIDGENITFIYSDISKQNVWDALANYRINKVIHLAAQAGVRFSLDAPMKYVSSNLVGFQNVIDFCVNNKIYKFIYASSSSVYGKDSLQPFNENESCINPESLYAATKRSNELVAKSYFNTKDISSFGLRFFTVYGPWGRPDMAPMLFANAALNEKKINVFNHGNQSRDFTYIDDIIDGIFKIMRYIENQEFKGAKVVNIGRGEPVNLLDFIEILEENLGYSVRKEFLPAQPGDVEVTYANTNLLSELTGYIPKIDLRDGIRHFCNWYTTYYSKS